MELQRLSEVIAKAEENTSGEIRVVLRYHRHWKEKKLSLHELTLNEFYHLRMEKTRDRTGVLILLLFSERKYHIIADEGIHSRVKEGVWDAIAEKMGQHFKEGRIFDGIAHAISIVGDELAKHFPRKADDTNELSNKIVED